MKVFLIITYCLLTGSTVFFIKSKQKVLTGQEQFTVKVTTYMAVASQTDETPYITASGFKLNKKNPRKHRIVAVSRDLKKKLGFGKKIKLQGTGSYDGVYVVEDVMNKRFKNRIDILINQKDKPVSFVSVTVVPL